MLSRSNSGSSVESLSTPMKGFQQDMSTGEYIVCMLPEDFNRLYKQNQTTQGQPVSQTLRRI